MMMRMMHKRRGQHGFTLIELLIVVAIIGIIAAILIPNLLDALQKAKQKRTIGDMRGTGTAWFSWLTDQVSAAAAGATGTWSGSVYPTIAASQLQEQLNPTGGDIFYMKTVPVKDGWGGSYWYGQASPLLSSEVMAIGSGGRNVGAGNAFDASGNTYTSGPFLASNYDCDIIWADGYFVTYPAGVKVQ